MPFPPKEHEPNFEELRARNLGCMREQEPSDPSATLPLSTPRNHREQKNICVVYWLYLWPLDKAYPNIKAHVIHPKPSQVSPLKPQGFHLDR